MHFLRKVFYPEVFQGRFKRRNYFEGWYFKLISKEKDHSIAVIPGISLGSHPREHHAFIQLIDGQTCEVDYFRFGFEEFSAEKSSFAVRIADNAFTDTAMRLNIAQGDRRVEGVFSFSNISKLNKSLSSPGIMGPFSFVPGMECYHGIVNVHHDVAGSLSVNGTDIDFTGGYGYIEKDWGKSFPEAWIWLQCNHFAEPQVSLMFSLAKIPILGSHFVGLISFLRVNDKEYRFATYTGAKLLHCSYTDNSLYVVLEDRGTRLTINARPGPAGLLKAPKNGMMTAYVNESISAEVEVTLSTLGGQTIYSGSGTNAGMEFVEGILAYLK
jgi:hypothetical protein